MNLVDRIAYAVRKRRAERSGYADEHNPMIPLHDAERDDVLTMLAELEKGSEAMDEAGRQAEAANTSGLNYCFMDVLKAMIAAGKAEE